MFRPISVLSVLTLCTSWIACSESTVTGPESQPQARSESQPQARVVHVQPEAIVSTTGVPMIDLGPYEAFDINSAGRVAGRSIDAPRMWVGGDPIDLANLPDSYYGQALAISSQGWVVGMSYTIAAGERGVLWRDGTVRQLDPLPGDARSIARAINDRGQIVGSSFGGPPYHAILWDGDQKINLGSLGGNAWAEAINNRGQVVGWSYAPDGTFRAFLWDRGSMIDLGGGPESQAKDINDAGWIVGSARLSDPTSSHATLWADGQATDLGTLGGRHSFAQSINASGQVAGTSRTTSNFTHAFIWEDGVMTDLGTIPGRFQSYARGINNKGHVVGTAIAPGGAGPRAVIWMP